MRKLVVCCCLSWGAFVAGVAQSACTVPADSLLLAENTPSSFVQTVTDWYAANMNYVGITALMTLESSFVPFPSEVVIPPAVYVAEAPDSPLNLTGSYLLNVLFIVLFGTLGAMIGAVVNYFLALWLGRPVVYALADSRFGHLLLLSGAKVRKAEDYFNRHGKVSTFVGRLIPGIRQLISIPAGLAKMNFFSFLSYTFMGAFIWNTVLALLGYVAHGQAELINRYSRELSVVLLVLFVVVIVSFGLHKLLCRCRR